MMRSIYSILRKALVLCAVTSLLITPPAAFAAQEPGAEQRKPDSNPLTFTQIDVPSTMLTAAFGINERGRIVGAYVDGSGLLSRRQ
jgi:hypothetical protein